MTREVLKPLPSDWEFVPEPGETGQPFYSEDPYYDAANDEYILTRDDKSHNTVARAFLKGNFSFRAKG